MQKAHIVVVLILFSFGTTRALFRFWMALQKQAREIKPLKFASLLKMKAPRVNIQKGRTDNNRLNLKVWTQIKLSAKFCFRKSFCGFGWKFSVWLSWNVFRMLVRWLTLSRFLRTTSRDLNEKNNCVWSTRWKLKASLRWNYIHLNMCKLVECSMKRSVAICWLNNLMLDIQWSLNALDCFSRNYGTFWLFISTYKHFDNTDLLISTRTCR